MKTVAKPIRILLIVVACLLTIVLLAYVGLLLYARAPFISYYRHAEKAFRLPGIDDGMIPQGLTYDPSRDTFFVSGYDVKKGPSSLYAVQGTTVKRVYLADEDGKAFSGHCGGIVYHGSYLYVAGSTRFCLYVLELEDVLQSKDGDTVRFCGKFDTFLGENDRVCASFTGGSDTHLYVGEYHNGKKYVMPEAHGYAYGDESYRALMLEYAYDDDAEWGLSPVPTRAFSIVNGVQGMCLNDDGDVFLSISGDFYYSHILQYDGASLPRIGNLSVGETTVPHYATALCAQKKDKKTPPMSEGILIKEDRLYAVSEFASDRHVLGKFTGNKYCFALDWSNY